MNELREALEIGAAAAEEVLNTMINAYTRPDGKVVDFRGRIARACADMEKVEAALAALASKAVEPRLTDEQKALAKLAFDVQQPHEWGYRGLVGEGFIADNTPFDLANSVVASLTPSVGEPNDN